MSLNTQLLNVTARRVSISRWASRWQDVWLLGVGCCARSHLERALLLPCLTWSIRQTSETHSKVSINREPTVLKVLSSRRSLISCFQIVVSYKSGNFPLSLNNKGQIIFFSSCYFTYLFFRSTSPRPTQLSGCHAKRLLSPKLVMSVYGW